MAQLTVRAPEELVERVKAAALGSQRSMNEYITLVLDAATDADLSGSEAERVRERLARAGLLAPPPSPRTPEPDAESVRAAGRRAARGTPLSELAVEGR